MKLTKKEFLMLKECLFDAETVKNFAQNIRKVRIYSEKGERIAHKIFIRLEKKYNFLFCACYAFFHGSSSRFSKNGKFYFKRVL